MAAFNDREVIEKIVLEYGKLVKNHMDIKNIYLYGSYAKGDYTLDSDIDVAVVSNEFTGDILEDTLMLMKLRREIDYRIEPRPFHANNFNLTNPFAKEIINNGILLI